MRKKKKRERIFHADYCLGRSRAKLHLDVWDRAAWPISVYPKKDSLCRLRMKLYLSFDREGNAQTIGDINLMGRSGVRRGQESPFNTDNWRTHYPHISISRAKGNKEGNPFTIGQCLIPGNRFVVSTTIQKSFSKKKKTKTHPKPETMTVGHNC